MTIIEIKVGVIDMPEKYASKMKEITTFKDLPNFVGIYQRAAQAAELAAGIIDGGKLDKACMIAGAPYLMSRLELELKSRDIVPLHAFSKRESEEKKCNRKMEALQKEMFLSTSDSYEWTKRMPKRIQLRRTKGWRMPANTIKVDRSSRWGNPYKVGDWAEDAAHAVVLFKVEKERLRYSDEEEFNAWLAPLRGKNLACWCALDAACHAEALLKWANDE